MKNTLTKEEFLNMFYAMLTGLKEEDAYYSMVVGMMNIIEHNPTLGKLQESLEFSDITEEDFVYHPFVKDYELKEEGLASTFKVSHEQMETLFEPFSQEIVDEFVAAMAFCINAAQLYDDTEGEVVYHTGDPNMTYFLATSSHIHPASQVMLYTDGNIKEIPTPQEDVKEYQSFNYVADRTVEVSDATYSLLVSTREDVVQEIQLRCLYLDNNYILEQVRQIEAGQNFSYDAIDDDLPKAYRLKRH